MTVSFGVAKVMLSYGTVVEPPLDGMTVFTGPNNSGKSLLLREIVPMSLMFGAPLREMTGRIRRLRSSKQR
jgi:ABC-type cobalamin/Fe3+-siderophores transport system ATPase subunit